MFSYKSIPKLIAWNAYSVFVMFVLFVSGVIDVHARSSRLSAASARGMLSGTNARNIRCMTCFTFALVCAKALATFLAVSFVMGRDAFEFLKIYSVSIASDGNFTKNAPVNYERLRYSSRGPSKMRSLSFSNVKSLVAALLIRALSWLATMTVPL